MRTATGQSEPGIDLSKIRELEERLDKFRIQTSSDMTIRGNAWQGYALNVYTCEELGLGGGTVVPTGACCIDGVCSVTSEAFCNLEGGEYQGDGTTCTPDPCVPTCPPVTHVSADFTFNADDGFRYFSGTGHVEGDLSFLCSATLGVLVPIIVHQHGFPDCSSGVLCNVGCNLLITYAGAGVWNLSTDVILPDHSCDCGVTWPPDSISASLSDTFSSFTYSNTLTPTTLIIMNAMIDLTLS